MSVSNSQSPQMEAAHNSLLGMFMGLALGDTLGMPLEFKQRGNFDPLTDLSEGGPFALPKGYWTDDTSMALCMADSFIKLGGYDSYDIMQRYANWQYKGYRSSTGVCFDVGNQVSTAIGQFSRQATVPTTEQRNNAPGQGAGNGTLMRLAPVVLATFNSTMRPEGLIEIARLSARETHFNTEAEQLTAIFAGMLFSLYIGVPKHRMYAFAGQWPISDQSKQRLMRAKELTESELKPTGYALDTLEVAIWAFMNSNSFKEGGLMAVNQGGDADTIGAVYGQLAGAHYGYKSTSSQAGLPVDWLEALHDVEEIERVAENLLRIENFHIIRTRFEEDRNQGWFAEP